VNNYYTKLMIHTFPKLNI